MKKEILRRSLLGAPLGITIAFLITLLVSLGMGDGQYHPAAPVLVTIWGSELNALLAETLCGAFIGALSAGASVIWEAEGWSLLRMTVTHLLVISLPCFPLAWLMHWVPHDPIGALTYAGIFLGVYAGIWFSQYAAMKKRIRQLNESLRKSGTLP